MYYIYSGDNENEALVKANTAISLINEKSQEVCQADWVSNAQRLTANPEIGENIYYFGFQAPPEIFANGATCDLETEFSDSWFTV